jgi:hypothetical protein
MKMQHDQFMEQSRQEFERWKIQFEQETKIVVAELAAKTTLKTASISANAGPEGLTEVSDTGETEPTSALASLVEAINTNMQQLVAMQQQSHQQLLETITKPKQVVRGPDGRMIGVQ